MKPELYVRLLDYWRKSDIPIAPPVQPHAIDRFEAFNEILLPPEVREYFSVVDGMIGNWRHDQDPQGFTFYQLGSLKEVPVDQSLAAAHFDVRECASVRCLAFAHYMDESWWYAVYLSRSCSKQSPVALVTELLPPVHRMVASTFGDFIAMYLANDANLYPSSDRDKLGDTNA